MAVFVRGDNNIKLDFLLKTIGIENRKIINYQEIDSVLAQPIDFGEIDKRVEIIRKSSQYYLQTALDRE